MAHFAKIDEQNIVIEVLVTDNNMPNEGYDWLTKTFGGRWIKTSYNTLHGEHLAGGIPLRKNYAANGFTYDEQRDAFIPTQPFPSWILDEKICDWQPPVPAPQTEKNYVWEEEQLAWVEITEE